MQSEVVVLYESPTISLTFNGRDTTMAIRCNPSGSVKVLTQLTLTDVMGLSLGLARALNQLPKEGDPHDGSARMDQRR
ncbi:MAG: hypothetical protein RLZZ598_1837 [Pseudomonadota bacterium]